MFHKSIILKNVSDAAKHRSANHLSEKHVKEQNIPYPYSVLVLWLTWLYKDFLRQQLLYPMLYRVYCRLGKLSPQTSWYWVPVNIGKQVPQSSADLLRPDSKLIPKIPIVLVKLFPIPTLAFPYVYLFTILLSTSFSAVLPLSFSASPPQLQAALTYKTFGQFVLRGVRLFHFYGCVQFVSLLILLNGFD